MTERPQVSSPSSAWEEEEIALYELLLVLWRRRKIILGIVLVCILLAGVYIMITPRVYRQTALVKLPLSNIPLSNMPLSNMPLVPLLFSEEAKEIVSQLQLLLRAKEWGELSRKLDLTQKEIQLLVDVRPQALKTQKNILKIVVEAQEPDVLPRVINKIVDYMNGNPYLQERLDLWQEILEHRERVTEKKLEDLKKLKDFLILQIRKGQLNTIGFNPLDLDGYILELEEKLEVIKAQRKLLRGVELVSLGPSPKSPYKPKKALVLSIAAVSGLFLGIFLVFFVEWVEKARRERPEKAIS